jgi:hypothetical protein
MIMRLLIKLNKPIGYLGIMSFLLAKDNLAVVAVITWVTWKMLKREILPESWIYTEDKDHDYNNDGKIG